MFSNYMPSGQVCLFETRDGKISDTTCGGEKSVELSPIEIRSGRDIIFSGLKEFLSLGSAGVNEFYYGAFIGGLICIRGWIFEDSQIRVRTLLASLRPDEIEVRVRFPFDASLVVERTSEGLILRTAEGVSRILYLVDYPVTSSEVRVTTQAGVHNLLGYAVKLRPWQKVIVKEEIVAAVRQRTNVTTEVAYRPSVVLFLLLFLRAASDSIGRLWNAWLGRVRYSIRAARQWLTIWSRSHGESE